ncbi:MAG: nucleotidyltransferase family protein [Actinomycetota bacterium]|nr:nucleotidyltransferase family protein [Actinomycetota bacterium]
MSTAAGLVLAAGAGRRLGGPKVLVDLCGQPLLGRAVATLTSGGCAPVVAVVPPELPVPPVPAELVRNPDWRTGMGSSLRVGLAALAADPRPRAVVVLLVDTPLVGAGAVRRLLAAHDDGAAVAIATYGGRRGHPVLVAREHWAEVAHLARGDVGARAFVLSAPERVVEVACDGTGDPMDIDTQEDLRRARAALGG